MNILTNQCPHSASRDHNCVAGRERRKSERQKDARGETGEILLLIGKRVDDGHRRICKNGLGGNSYFIQGNRFPFPCFVLQGGFSLLPSIPNATSGFSRPCSVCGQSTNERPTDRSGPSMSTVITCIWEPCTAAPNHQI